MLNPSDLPCGAQAANERQIYLQSLSEEHRERAHQLHQTIERSSPAIEFRLDHGVEECRQEARALIRELREQRTREWARQTANLRRMRDETSPRVDDTFSQEVPCSYPRELHRYECRCIQSICCFRLLFVLSITDLRERLGIFICATNDGNGTFSRNFISKTEECRFARAPTMAITNA